MKNSKGITLIALVVTVIIILIFSGISINLLSGEEGVLIKATDAVDKTTIETAKEEMEMKLAEVLIDYYEDVYVNKSYSVNTVKRDYIQEKCSTGTTSSGYQFTINNGTVTIIATNSLEKDIVGSMDAQGIVTWNSEDNEPITNIDTSKTNPIKALPSQASVVVGDATEGIVMKDTNENEWVWIEVPSTVFKTAKSSSDYANIKEDLIKYATDYRKGSATQTYNWKDEWYDGCGIADNDTYINMYNRMLSSVYSNKGFWIGRYEIGDGTATESNVERTNATGTSNTPVIKANQYPYNFVSCSEAQSLASTLGTGGKTSSLLFGIQWDLVCKFLEEKSDLTLEDINTNSISWGNYANSSLILTRGQYNSNIVVPEGTNNWKAFNIAEANFVNYDETTKQYSTDADPSYGQLLTTAASEDTRKMNIYDFAGNVWEYTLERPIVYDYEGNDICGSRGGNCGWYGDVDAASFRNATKLTETKKGIGFRATLY